MYTEEIHCGKYSGGRKKLRNTLDRTLRDIKTSHETERLLIDPTKLLL